MIKHNFSKENTYNSPKNNSPFCSNYQKVNTIVQQVEKMNLDITSQNKQLKDILIFLKNNESAKNANRQLKKSVNHNLSKYSECNEFGSAKTIQTKTIEVAVANFSAQLDEKLKDTRKSRNKETILKEKSNTIHLTISSKKHIQKLKSLQSSSYDKNQNTDQSIKNTQQVQNINYYKPRKISKSMKRCQSCTKIKITQEQSNSKNKNTQKNKKRPLHASTSVLLFNEKGNSSSIQNISKEKKKIGKLSNGQKISLNTHAIILGSPKNFGLGYSVTSSQKSQIKDMLKSKNKKRSLLLTQKRSPTKYIFF